MSRIQLQILRFLDDCSVFHKNAWVSFYPTGHTSQLRSLNSKGLVELNHFVGYRITELGRKELLQYS